ncbi:hypothetical protein ABW19_dt0201282 [Dactylella cylindrospora]|nr:hypothetical protein ABW19_dt0201282 [Dactylella cylindrospora]
MSTSSTSQTSETKIKRKQRKQRKVRERCLGLMKEKNIFPEKTRVTDEEFKKVFTFKSEGSGDKGTTRGNKGTKKWDQHPACIWLVEHNPCKHKPQQRDPSCTSSYCSKQWEYVPEIVESRPLSRLRTQELDLLIDLLKKGRLQIFLWDCDNNRVDSEDVDSERLLPSSFNTTSPLGLAMDGDFDNGIGSAIEDKRIGQSPPTVDGLAGGVAFPGGIPPKRSDTPRSCQPPLSKITDLADSEDETFEGIVAKAMEGLRVNESVISARLSVQTECFTGCLNKLQGKHNRLQGEVRELKDEIVRLRGELDQLRSPTGDASRGGS